MKIKSQIKPVESFIITIEGIECSPFTKESTWNGLVCYRNKHGVIIAVDESSFVDKLFQNINNDGHKYSDLNILTCSPCFMPSDNSSEGEGI